MSELRALDVLWRHAWARATAGSVHAARECQAIEASRARLLGLGVQA